MTPSETHGALMFPSASPVTRVGVVKVAISAEATATKNKEESDERSSVISDKGAFSLKVMSSRRKGEKTLLFRENQHSK